MVKINNLASTTQAWTSGVVVQALARISSYIVSNLAVDIWKSFGLIKMRLENGSIQ